MSQRSSLTAAALVLGGAIGVVAWFFAAVIQDPAVLSWAIVATIVAGVMLYTTFWMTSSLFRRQPAWCNLIVRRVVIVNIVAVELGLLCFTLLVPLNVLSDNNGRLLPYFFALSFFVLNVGLLAFIVLAGATRSISRIRAFIMAAVALAGFVVAIGYPQYDYFGNVLLFGALLILGLSMRPDPSY